MSNHCAINRSCRVKSIPKSPGVTQFFSRQFGACILLIAGCTLAGQASAGVLAQATGPKVERAKSETEVIRLHANQLPDVTLTGTILFKILAAEIAAQRGNYLAAGNTLSELARETADPRLARRALEFYLAGGNLTGALDASRTWLRIAPNDDEAVSTELALGAAAGQTTGLAQALRKRIDKSTDKPAAITQAVTTLARMQNKQEAFSILSEAINQSSVKNLPAARLALADMAQSSGDSKQALAEARIALGANPGSEDAAARVLEYGVAVDADAAIAEVAAFTKRQPKARRVRLLLAGQLSDRGRYSEAMAEVQSMLRNAPEDFELLFVQAQLAARAKQWPDAKKFIDQFINVQTQRKGAGPDGASDAGVALSDAYQFRAGVFEEMGRLDDAYADLSLIKDPATAVFAAQMRQAAIRGKQGRVDEAVAILDAAQPEDDESADVVLVTTSQVLRNAKRIDEAIKRLQVADKERGSSKSVKYDLAMLYEQQNNLPEAERLLRQVIVLDSRHAHAYNALGYALADRNIRLDEALVLIKKATELAPNDPFIMDSLGWVKFRMGDYPAALEILTRAYSKRPEADIAAHLGEVYWVQGDRDKARALWREGLSKEASNATLVETMKRFGAAP